MLLKGNELNKLINLRYKHKTVFKKDAKVAHLITIFVPFTKHTTNYIELIVLFLRSHSLQWDLHCKNPKHLVQVPVSLITWVTRRSWRSVLYESQKNKLCVLTVAHSGPWERCSDLWISVTDLELSLYFIHKNWSKTFGLYNRKPCGIVWPF